MIGVQHTHQSDVGKIKSFRHHLRADENIVFTVGEGSQLLLVR